MADNKLNKKSIVNWLQKKASQVQQGIEQGVVKSMEIREAIHEKIEANPKAKAARDISAEFIKAQAERLSDMRINGKRIGDLPHAAQKLTERQLYKILFKMREIDPDLNWDQFLPDNNEMPVFAAFEKLGLPYGTPYEEVKKTYRRLMREYHPDKHSESPEAERLATEKTQELTAAYELISEHYGK